MPSQKVADFFSLVTIDEVLSEPPSLPCLNTHYLVDLKDDEGNDDL